jgi:hypothetical protein
MGRVAIGTRVCTHVRSSRETLNLGSLEFHIRIGNCPKTSLALRSKADGSIDALLQFKPQSRDRCSGSRLCGDGMEASLTCCPCCPFLLGLDRSGGSS